MFGVDPGEDRAEKFLTRLSGLVRHALKHNQGQVELQALAAATAQREATVRAGLDWLEARGYIQVLQQPNGSLALAGSDGVSADTLQQMGAQMKMLLEETAAYRAHFARAEARSLVVVALPDQAQPSAGER